jgi:hypothetical protein
MAVGLGQIGVDQRPFQFSISACPVKRSLTSLPGLAESLASGSVVEACVSLDPFSP